MRYIDRQKIIINGIETEVTTYSRYPIPWDGARKKRPKNYYDKQFKVIRYTKPASTPEQAERVEIVIPRVNKGENRHRGLKVKVNGRRVYCAAQANILDMRRSMDSQDLNLLFSMIDNHHNKDVSLITPFVYLPEAYADYKNYHFNLETNKASRVLPCYIENMMVQVGKNRELLIPVVTKGCPYHVNLCLFKISADEQSSLHYIETGNLLSEEGYIGYRFYREDYDLLMNLINSCLIPEHFQLLKEVGYSQWRQFSLAGCAIATSLIIENILQDRYPKTIDVEAFKASACRLSKKEDGQVKRCSEAISIDRDALRRTMFMFKINARKKIEKELLEEQQVDPALLDKKKKVGLELLTHPHSLKMKNEAYRSFYRNGL